MISFSVSCQSHTALEVAGVLYQKAETEQTTLPFYLLSETEQCFFFF